MSKCVGAAHSPPCITARRGGCVINKCREATETDAAGVVFLFVLNRKTTPASRSAEASLNSIDCSATPPYFRLRAGPLALRGGDARRGMCAPTHFDIFFTAP